MPDEAHSQTSLLDDFSEALLQPQCPMPHGIIGPDGKPAPKRFSVYRNNVAVSLVEAIEESFPAVQKMLGEEYFKALARAFVAEYPPTSPVLLWYGDRFPGFIEDFEPLKAYPYLSDVAQLEWTWLEAYHAEDAPVLDPGVLSAVDPEKLGQVRFTIHPAVRVVKSVWPVFSLVAANRFDEEGDHAIDMDDPQDVLVARPDLDVAILLLRPGAAVFLECLQEGRTLGAAAEAAASEHEAFDLGATLGDFLTNGVFGAHLDHVRSSRGGLNERNA
ncbi:DNA-binding domain-containing protein [Roseibium sp.]|uniref:HvfC/BufC N-terminal domain-containing protein n=1 Tax=Roseibium sp. TaxID=1936156 RepID=UPI003A969AA7